MMATKLATVQDALNELPSPTLHSAMALAFAEIESATKSAENPAFKQGGKASKYADLTSIIEAIKPALINHGLFLTQRCQPAEDGVSVETVLHHFSGEKESLGTLYVPANNRNPQGFGSALTYARRYALQTAFCVPVEDDDGNAGSQGVKDSKFITDKQRDDLEALAGEVGVAVGRVCKFFDVRTLSCLPAEKYEEAVEKLRASRKEPVNA